jgi:hypothetical protein
MQVNRTGASAPPSRTRASLELVNGRFRPKAVNRTNLPPRHRAAMVYWAGLFALNR